jgi:hypothetical protein
MPEEHAPGRIDVVGARRLGRLRIGQDVVAADRLVAAVEDVALPLADEHALGGAALVAGVGVDRAGAARRPAHDLDPAFGRVVHQPAVAGERLGGGGDERHGHRPEAGGQVGMEVVDRSGHAAPRNRNGRDRALGRGS